MRLFANANYPFMDWRYRAYALSAVLLVAGLVAVIVNIATIGSWVRYGVDFTGGTLVHIDFAQDVTADQIRDVNSNWEITRFGEPAESEYLIRVPTFENRLDVDPATVVSSTLAEAFGPDAFEVVRTEAVSARVGGELQQRALFAILASFVTTLIYLAIRFEWRFGVAAVVATAHDILITLGFIALLRMEVSIATVAAILTVVGYSLNDTIVVFDRIRENLAKRKRDETFRQIATRSINETLPRTTLTSATTLVTLFMLYVFGGAVIRDFALVLILGISIGTFSSIFVASPALAAIEAKWPRTASRKAVSGSAARRRAAARV